MTTMSTMSTMSTNLQSKDERKKAARIKEARYVISKAQDIMEILSKNIVEANRTLLECGEPEVTTRIVVPELFGHPDGPIRKR
jgi:hypothetical protein